MNDVWLRLPVDWKEIMELLGVRTPAARADCGSAAYETCGWVELTKVVDGAGIIIGGLRLDWVVGVDEKKNWDWGFLRKRGIRINSRTRRGKKKPKRRRFAQEIV